MNENNCWGDSKVLCSCRYNAYMCDFDDNAWNRIKYKSPTPSNCTTHTVDFVRGGFGEK